MTIRSVCSRSFLVGLVLVFLSTPTWGAGDTRSFVAKSLKLRDLAGFIVSVQVGNKERIMVVAEDWSVVEERARITATRDQLTIQGKSRQQVFQSSSSGPINSSVIVSGVGSRAEVTIGGQTMVVEGASTAPVPLRIYVPEKTPLTLLGSFVDLTAGDLRGAVEARISGAGEIRLGALGRLRADLDGAVVFHAGAVQRDLWVRATGAVEAGIDRGTVDHAYIMVVGASEVFFGGKAQTAELRNDGAGTIRVGAVGERPIIYNRGFGDITAGGW